MARRRLVVVVGLCAAALSALWGLRPPPAAAAPAISGALIAHRAGRVPGPDNSLAAIAHAASAGADAVELDVRWGLQGELVCAHDAEQASGAPLLEEMLDAALSRGLLVELDLKTPLWGDRALVSAVAAVVSARHAYDRVWVSAFQPVTAWQVRSVDPALALGWPMPGTGVPMLDALVAWDGVARWLGASVLEPEIDLVTDARLARWERSFSAIEIWVVEETWAEHYREAGAAVVVDSVEAR